MNIPALETEIAQKILNMDMDQKMDVMKYIERLSSKTSQAENYRKRAIKEIRTALKAI